MIELDIKPLIKLEPNFSKAEAAVYNLLLKGLPSKDIAQKLFVTEKTVKGHLTVIYKKLGIRGRRDINFSKAAQ